MLLAPAMNCAMWTHPVTRAHLDAVRAFGAVVVPPIAKRLACGDVGIGAMEEVPAIVARVELAVADWRAALHTPPARPV